MDPFTVVMGLAQLAPSLMRFFGVGEKNAVLVDKVIDIAKTVTGTPTGEDALVALQQDPALAFQFQQKVLDNDKELEIAYLADRQDARKRDIEFIKMGKTNVRANAMLVCTFIGLFGSVMAMIHYNVDANSAVGGALLLLIGKFLGNWGTAFDFEFGSSRGSKEKDDTQAIMNLKGLRK